MDPLSRASPSGCSTLRPSQQDVIGLPRHVAKLSTMTAEIRLAWWLVFLVLSGACANSTAPSLPIGSSTNNLHAEVTDPAGDAVTSPGVTHPPDLVHGTVDVSGGSITLDIQFATGTFDRNSTLTLIQLDTEDRKSTRL